MNLPHTNHLLESAFTWTWKTSLEATVLIALVLLIQFAFVKILSPRWRYFFGLLILLRLVLPATPASPLSIFNLGNHRDTMTHVDNSIAPARPAVIPIISAAPMAPIAGPATPDVALVFRPALPATSTISIRAIAAWVWLAGFLGMLAMVVGQHLNFVRKLGRWERVREPRVIELLESCRTMLGVRRNVIVLVATGLNTPALFGIARPRLLLPVEMLERLDDRELRHVLLHELIHLKRGDLFVNWAMILVRAAHWFNPAVWLAFRRLRAEQELACDAAVMARLADDERRHYGRTLLKLLDDFSPGALCPGLVPFITSKQIIKRRITMISNFKPAGRIAAVTSVVLLLALGSLTFTRAADQTTATVDANPKDGSNRTVTSESSGAIKQTSATVARVGGLVTVTIGKDGNFRVGGSQQPVDLEQLTKTLQDEFTQNPQWKLLIRTDDSTSINDLEDVINLAKRLKIASITFRDVGTSSAVVEKAPPYSEAQRAEAEQAQIDARTELARTREELADLRAKTSQANANLFVDAANADLKAPVQTFTTDQLVVIRTDSLDKTKKDLEENIRLTAAKLNDLRNLKETYASDLVEHSSDQKQVVARLSDAIADAESQRAKQQALLNQLRNMGHDELRQALPTTVPDAILTKLMQDELTAEAKMTEQRANMGENNPELVATRKLAEKLNSQIDARVKGILNALRVQVDAANASIESLRNEINAQSKRQAELSDLASQITQLEKDLQSLQSERSQVSGSLKNSFMASPPNSTSAVR